MFSSLILTLMGQDVLSPITTKRHSAEVAKTAEAEPKNRRQTLAQLKRKLCPVWMQELTAEERKSVMGSLNKGKKLARILKTISDKYEKNDKDALVKSIEQYKELFAQFKGKKLSVLKSILSDLKNGRTNSLMNALSEDQAEEFADYVKKYVALGNKSAKTLAKQAAEDNTEVKVLKAELELMRTLMKQTATAQQQKKDPMVEIKEIEQELRDLELGYVKKQAECSTLWASNMAKVQKLEEEQHQLNYEVLRADGFLANSAPFAQDLQTKAHLIGVAHRFDAFLRQLAQQQAYPAYAQQALDQASRHGDILESVYTAIVDRINQMLGNPQFQDQNKEGLTAAKRAYEAFIAKTREILNALADEMASRLSVQEQLRGMEKHMTVLKAKALELRQSMHVSEIEKRMDAIKNDTMSASKKSLELFRRLGDVKTPQERGVIRSQIAAMEIQKSQKFAEWACCGANPSAITVPAPFPVPAAPHYVQQWPQQVFPMNAPAPHHPYNMALPQQVVPTKGCAPVPAQQNQQAFQQGQNNVQFFSAAGVYDQAVPPPPPGGANEVRENC